MCIVIITCSFKSVIQNEDLAHGVQVILFFVISFYAFQLYFLEVHYCGAEEGQDAASGLAAPRPGHQMARRQEHNWNWAVVIAVQQHSCSDWHIKRMYGFSPV